MKLSVNIATKLLLAPRTKGSEFYSDWTIDMLHVGFLDDNFLGFETQLADLCFG
jgi:hypothetical protein